MSPVPGIIPLSPTDALKEIAKKNHKELGAWLKITPVGKDVAGALKEAQITGRTLAEWYNSGEMLDFKKFSAQHASLFLTGGDLKKLNKAIATGDKLNEAGIASP